jgi:N-acetylglucosaminyldiphosphoundecaprenol N-acetyl-beta-D-mannosaminyltransferase
MTIIDSIHSFDAHGSLATATRSSSSELGTSAAPAASDDFSREVFGLFGIPIDAVEMDEAVRRIRFAADHKVRFLLSTANLNFLIASRRDWELRDSLLKSDLCTADGMPIVWIARLLGIPIAGRVAGSDIFDTLKNVGTPWRKLKLFLFGGDAGVAAIAGDRINAESGDIVCVGWLNPGFCSINDMSSDDIVAAINESGADVLAAALGAQKGQAWLLRNHDRLTVPVRSHLGATLNFQAGIVKRAPRLVRRWGLEWLWRVKEEPHLWMRYRNDGWAFLKMIPTEVIPLLALTVLQKLRPGAGGFSIAISSGTSQVVCKLEGDATGAWVGKAIAAFRQVVSPHHKVVLDLSGVKKIDFRFIGTLLMLRKQLIGHGQSLEFVALTPSIKSIFHLSGFDFLLGHSA